MAVYDRNFGIYQGARTPTWSRFLILPATPTRRCSRAACS